LEGDSTKLNQDLLRNQKSSMNHWRLEIASLIPNLELKHVRIMKDRCNKTFILGASSSRISKEKIGASSSRISKEKIDNFTSRMMLRASYRIMWEDQGYSVM
jgi:hypothetical protein